MRFRSVNRRLLLAFGAVILTVGVALTLLTRSGGPSATPTDSAAGPSNDEPARRAETPSPAEVGLDPIETAIEYATASQDWLYLSDTQIDDAVREIAVPERADQLARETVAELSVARDGLMQSAGRVWWLVRPMATKAGPVSADRAEVSVWIVTVLSAADVAVPQSDWSTLDLILARREGRWLLESIEDRPGPTPISGVRDDPWQPEPFDDALDGFDRVGSETS